MYDDVAGQLRYGEIDRLNLKLGFPYFRIKSVYLSLKRLMLILGGIEQLLLHCNLALDRVKLGLERLLAVYDRLHYATLREYRCRNGNERAPEQK